MSGRVVWILGFVVVSLSVLVLGIRFGFGRMLDTGGVPRDAIRKTVTSKDGTLVAYEQTGSGPVIVLVSAALVDRNGARPLARQLASSFTVVNYDRRGRGESSNTEPYAVQREIEDVEAFVDAAGGSAYLFGSSSGSVLALDVASRLGTKVTRLFLYEPPLIVDNSRPPIPDSLLDEVRASLAAKNRDEAVSLFFSKGMGIPTVGVTAMRLLMPGWADMAKVAHTAPYDLMILAGTQSGKSLPAERWSGALAPTCVAVGSKSEAFFHSGAKALAHALHHVEYWSLDGLDHSAVLMTPEALAAAVRQFTTKSK